MTDFTELKKKQRATWALGEYDRIVDRPDDLDRPDTARANIRPGELPW